MNASPGGKTSHIIQLTRGKALVVAFDRSIKKIETLRNTLTRLGLYTNVVLLPMDSRYSDLDTLLANKADKVIVDPPCTALGVRPKLLFDRSVEDILVLSKYQAQFLKTAVRIAKKGGLIAYSTCTITFQENELNTIQVIDEYGLESIDLGFLPYSEKVKYRGLIAYRFSPLTSDMPGYYLSILRKP
ncbi:MAG: RsmB/NOP family class I SAM-dependent RNA methyltransferase [Thermoprotei archaeon]